MLEPFQNNSDEIKNAFTDLGSYLTSNTKHCNQTYVCKLYEPDTCVTNVINLRWWMFRGKQAESDKLP